MLSGQYLADFRRPDSVHAVSMTMIDGVGESPLPSKDEEGRHRDRESCIVSGSGACAAIQRRFEPGTEMLDAFTKD